MKKTLSKLKNRSIFPQSAVKIIFNGDILNGFPLRSVTRKEWPFSPLVFTLVLEVLSSIIKQGK